MSRIRTITALTSAALVASWAIAAGVVAAASAAGAGRDATPTGERPGVGLPVVKAYRYRMAGRVRPLLAFWIGRDDVGMARIVWRDDGEGRRAYELLVGTDPSYAPRAINRWGFVIEQASGHDGSTLAMMSRSDEGSFRDAQMSVEGGTRGADFKVMRGLVHDGVATSNVTILRAPGTPTVHDAARMTEQTWAEAATARPRAVAVGREVRPGFLVAVAELVDRTLAAATTQGLEAAALDGVVVPYVFGRDLYELRVRTFEVSEAQVLGGPARVAQTGFEIRKRSTGARSRFGMSYAVDGAMAGVPLTVAWQPRWWLKVELHLAQDAARVARNDSTRSMTAGQR